MTGHAERIEKALNGGNRFRRADVADLLHENDRLRAAMARLAEHRTLSYPSLVATYTTCAGYPGCHHCWAAKQLKHITTTPAGSAPKEATDGDA